MPGPPDSDKGGGRGRPLCLLVVGTDRGRDGTTIGLVTSEKEKYDFETKL